MWQMARGCGLNRGRAAAAVSDDRGRQRCCDPQPGRIPHHAPHALLPAGSHTRRGERAEAADGHRRPSPDECIHRRGQVVVFAAPSTTPLPVVNATARQPAGSMLFSAANSSMTCTLPAGGDNSTQPSGSVVPVDSPQEFLAALFAATSTTGAADVVIELQQDILVTSESAHAYSLPFVLGGGGGGGGSGGSSMVWRGAGDALVHLGLGGVAGLLYLQAGSSLS
ncbi:hypothetical protein ABPG75_006019 [Micractinium tetrahymenae]